MFSWDFSHLLLIDVFQWLSKWCHLFFLTRSCTVKVMKLLCCPYEQKQVKSPHLLVFFFSWIAGDSKEPCGGSHRRCRAGTGVRTDPLPPGPRSEDASHVTDAVSLLRQVSHLYLKGAWNSQTPTLTSSR